MKNYFTTKEVVSLSLGEKLKKARLEKNLTFHQISDATKIQVKYLENLENGNYEALPADVYIKGFLKMLAPILELNAQEIINCYKKERAISEQLGKKDFKKNQLISMSAPKFIITPKTIFIIASVFLFIAIGGWLVWQISSFSSPPNLILNNPQSDLTVKSSNFILEGNTEKEAELFINGENILPDENGHFKEQINLQPGLNAIEITAKNRFGKETTIIRRIILEE
jgi:cytoskeletal protein RodZ